MVVAQSANNCKGTLGISPVKLRAKTITFNVLRNPYVASTAVDYLMDNYTPDQIEDMVDPYRARGIDVTINHGR